MSGENQCLVAKVATDDLPKKVRIFSCVQDADHPTDLFINLEPENPSIDESELDEICRSTDSEAL